MFAQMDILTSLVCPRMQQLLAFYDHRKDKTKIKHHHSVFQEPASIEQM